MKCVLISAIKVKGIVHSKLFTLILHIYSGYIWVWCWTHSQHACRTKNASCVGRTQRHGTIWLICLLLLCWWRLWWRFLSCIFYWVKDYLSQNSPKFRQKIRWNLRDSSVFMAYSCRAQQVSLHAVQTILGELFKPGCQFCTRMRDV